MSLANTAEGVQLDNAAIGFQGGGTNNTIPALVTRTTLGTLCNRAGSTGVGPFPGGISVIERRDHSPPLLVALARDGDDDGGGVDGLSSRVATFRIDGSSFTALSPQVDYDDGDDTGEEAGPLPGGLAPTFTLSKHGNEFLVIRPAHPGQFYGVSRNGGERGALFSTRVTGAGTIDGIVDGPTVTTPGPITSSIVADGFLFLQHRTSLRAFDPPNLNELRPASIAKDGGGQVASPGGLGMALLGHLLYAIGEDRLRVFDVSDPINVRRVEISTSNVPETAAAGAISPGGRDVVNGTGFSAPVNPGNIVNVASPVAVFLTCNGVADCAQGGPNKTVALTSCSVNDTAGGFGDLTCASPVTIATNARAARGLAVVGTSVFVLVENANGIGVVHQRSVADVSWVDFCFPRVPRDLNSNKTPDLCDPAAPTPFSQTSITAMNVEGSTLSLIVKDDSALPPDNQRLTTYEIPRDGLAAFGPRILRHANANAFNLEDGRIFGSDNDPSFHNVGLGELTERTIKTVFTSGGMAFVGPVVTDPNDALEVRAMPMATA